MTWQGYKIKEDAGELQYSNCCETAPACRSNAPWQRLLQLFAVLPLHRRRITLLFYSQWGCRNFLPSPSSLTTPWRSSGRWWTSRLRCPRWCCRWCCRWLPDRGRRRTRGRRVRRACYGLVRSGWYGRWPRGRWGGCRSRPPRELSPTRWTGAWSLDRLWLWPEDNTKMVKTKRAITLPPTHSWPGVRHHKCGRRHISAVSHGTEMY